MITSLIALGSTIVTAIVTFYIARMNVTKDSHHTTNDELFRIIEMQREEIQELRNEIKELNEKLDEWRGL